MVAKLKPPTPWIGGKSRAVELLWSRLGNPYNYAVPFAGMIPDILARPHEPTAEVINDINPYVANAFRALREDPHGVAYWADRAINEADLHAVHRWIVGLSDIEPLVPERYRENELATEAFLAGYKRQDGSYIKAFRRLMIEDPDHYDARIAGRWLWGQSQWIGSDWCPVFEEGNEREPSAKRPNIGDSGAGRGIMALTQKRPCVARKGTEVHSESLYQKKPQIQRGEEGQGVLREQGGLLDYFERIAERLRRVRILCGDWKRCVTSAVLMTEQKDREITVAVFLDPPYPAEAERQSNLYACDSLTVGVDAWHWALENGNRKNLKIALCGLEDQHPMPEDWECVAWKGSGYGNQGEGRGRDNSQRERIWFSPHCIQERTLFD